MDSEGLWRKLSDNQRLYLVNAVVPPNLRQDQSAAVVAGRSLDRLGLTRSSAAGRQLVQWALTQGYARHVQGRWVFTAPAPRPRTFGRIIDPEKLVELIEAGHYGSEIARRLGVTREAVRLAAQRRGLELPRRQRKPRPKRQPKPRRERVVREVQVSFRVSAAEREAVKRAATQRGMTVAAYLREVSVPRPG